MPLATRTICIILALGLLGLLIYGMIYAPGVGALQQSMKPFWGKFVWADVTVGFVLMTTVITTYERNLAIGLLMFVLMNLFGNIVVAAWLLWRGPSFYSRLRSAAAA